MDLQFFQQEYLWGVTLWRLCLAAALLLLEFIVRPVMRRLVGVATRLGKESKKKWAEEFNRLMPKPLSLLVTVLLWYAITRVLDLPVEPLNVHLVVTRGLLVALIVALVAAVFRLIDVAAGVALRKAEETESRTDDQIVPFARTIAKVGVVVIVSIAVADSLSVPVTSFIASLSIGGLALALAAKDAVANFFGFVVVLTDRPFIVGDVVDVDGTEGVIEQIGLRVTRIRQFDQSVATIPNQSFTTTTVVNHSLRKKRRIRHQVVLDGRTTPDQIEAFIASLHTQLSEVGGIDTATMVVRLESMEESGYGILVQVLTTRPDLGAFMEAQEAILMRILRLVEAQGLGLAYPARTLFLERGEDPP